jgi:hypothetical protein
MLIQIKPFHTHTDAFALECESIPVPEHILNDPNTIGICWYGRHNKNKRSKFGEIFCFNLKLKQYEFYDISGDITELLTSGTWSEVINELVHEFIINFFLVRLLIPLILDKQ